MGLRVVQGPLILLEQRFVDSIRKTLEIVPHSDRFNKRIEDSLHSISSNNSFGCLNQNQNHSTYEETYH